MRRVLFGLALGAALMGAGCGNTATAMRPATAGTDAHVVEGQAVVVFVRHSRLGKKVSFPIVTEAGEFVAILRGKMHASVTVPAGHHRFVVLAENAEVVEVSHAMTERLATWGEVCERAARPLGDTPASAPVENNTAFLAKSPGAFATKRSASSM